MKKYITLIPITIALAVGAFYSEKAFLASQAVPLVKSPEVTSSEIELKPQSQPHREQGRELVTSATKPTPNVTLFVGSTTYPVYASEHASVLDAMRLLASTSDFTFSGRDYQSLGFFVESIGGKKQMDGYVWIFYLNGEKAQKGISQTILSAGDTIEWKYEKSY